MICISCWKLIDLPNLRFHAPEEHGLRDLAKLACQTRWLMIANTPSMKLVFG